MLWDPCGDGLGGGVALTLGGLLCWRCAGDEGAEEVADDGLLLESSWLEERLHSSLLVITWGKVTYCRGITAA